MNLIKLILISSLLISCSSVTYKKIDHSVVLDDETTFCISNNEDKIGTIRNLKHIFEEEGFHMIPFENASKAMNNKKTFGETSLNKDLEKAFNIKNIDKVFVIILDYSYSNDGLDTYYKDFKYSIVNLNNGKSIGWGFTYAAELSPKRNNLKKVVKKIKQKLLN